MRTGNHAFTAEITWLITQLSKLLRALCDNIHWLDSLKERHFPRFPGFYYSVITVTKSITYKHCFCLVS